MIVSFTPWRLAALLTAVACLHRTAAQAQTDEGTPARKGTVVNGHPAGNAYPFFCSLTTPSGTSTANFTPECGASLIAPQWVLTAGHCVIDFMSSGPGNELTYDSLDVVVAPNIIGQSAPNSVRVRSDYIIKHAGFVLFSTDLTDDIALIHLRTPVTIAPVTLPAQGDNSLNQAGADVVGMGYGIYDTVTLASPDTLQMVNIKIIHNDTCNTPQRYDGQVGTRMLCAGMLTGRATGNAAGDSGGPLFVENGTSRIQVGVVSWGHNSYANATYPGIYTRLAAYRTWIDSVINAHDHPTNVPDPGKPLQAIVSVQQGILRVQLATSLNVPGECAVYDMTGKVIAMGKLPAGTAKYEMPLPEMASGIYLFRLQLQDGRSFRSKFPVGE